MDLLQRLIAGSGTASKQPRPPSHQERLGSCKRLCNALHQIWRSSTSLVNDETTSSHVANIIRRLNTILDEESRKAAPHSCLVHTASTQLYIILAKLVLSSADPEIIHHSVKFFRILINGEVEGVLDQRIFARSTTDLVKYCLSPANRIVDRKGESALIELLFEVCTKIRLDPDILPAWFYPDRPSKSSNAESRRHQFPLFYILIDYVHYDGTIGDFARTALLYLTETAPKSRPLEKWMMESDLAHQIASGLSALYARLSRSAKQLDKETLPILCFSDLTPDRQISMTVEETDRDMRAFLAYLAFWQDTLSHCKSVEVKDTLLDSFQVLFVEQLLYPSLLESSDVEGGSTSAVIIHLCRLLTELEHPQLVTRMLGYLFATKSHPAVAKTHGSRSRMSLSRKRSVDQLATLISQSNNLSPELFNLLDLITFSLRSNTAQTVSATLKLVATLLQKHHPHVKHQLFTLEALSLTSRHNLNKLTDTMMTLFDCASSISQVKTIDASYQAALRDAQVTMEHHSCLFDEYAVRTSEVNQMGLISSCKVMDQLLNILESWFSNDTIVNLELTGCFMALAACEFVLMRSWFTPEVNVNSGVVSVLRDLTAQVRQWRVQFVEWDAFYSIQRVELSNEEDSRAFEQRRNHVQEDSLSNADTAFSGSPPSSPKLLSKKIAALNIDSIDNRMASNGSTIVASQHSRQASDAGQRQRSLQQPNHPADDLSITLLETRIPIRSHSAKSDMSTNNEEAVDDKDVAQITDEAETEQDTAVDTPTASLRHVLTQAIILQEFILEMAAALQIRATLFDEIDLS